MDDNGRKAIHAGHRARLRERLRCEGMDAFSEHEVLELLLTYAIPRRDVNPLAHELIARFGSLADVMEAGEGELMRVPGMGEGAALLLSMMPQLLRRYQRSAQGERPVITNYAQARAYCESLFMGVRYEHLYMICLSKSGRVLHQALLHTGTIDEVALYPRLIVQTALRFNAYSVLLAHNHPSGVAGPSKADCAATDAVAKALATVGIRTADHLIFAGGAVYSMMHRAQDARPGDEMILPDERETAGGGQEPDRPLEGDGHAK